MMHFGGLEVQTPAGELRMYGRNWLKLETAFVLAVEGFDFAARRYVVGLEADLQREANLRAQAAAAKAAPRRRQRIYRDEPTPNADNLADVDKIEAQEWLARDARRRKDHKKAKAHFDRAADIRDAIGADIASRQDDRWAQLALRETAALEEARGEAVDLDQINGKVRGLKIKTRDGLLAMFPCRELDQTARARSQILLKAGMEYRSIYDDSKLELGSCIAKLGCGPGGDGEQLAERIAEGKARLAKLEAAVVADQVNGRGLTSLRQIAGEGRTLSFLATSGKNKDLYSKALKRALGVVAKELRIERTATTLYRC